MEHTAPTTEKQTALDIEQFTYELPLELIAQTPAEKRDSSRLLVLERATGATRHHVFSDIVDMFEPGDVIVVNDTRVIPARLYARKPSGGRVKFLLLKPEATNPAMWEAMVTPIKRLKEGDELEVESKSNKYKIRVAAFRLGPDGFKRLLLDLGDPGNVFPLLNEAGFAPLPPYIQRKESALTACRQSDKQAADQSLSRAADLERYQTVFAREPGAVAAPTAGLHFSPELIDRLRQKGVHLHTVTLHVGAGTFKPITSSVEEHTIEEERFSIPAETRDAVNHARAKGRRVIAVGTTSLRALETAGASGKLEAMRDASTTLYVKPGNTFKIVDCLITNFHLSRSSLLVLVSAFAGRERVMRAYEEAVKMRYRFYSYGDAMLII